MHDFSNRLQDATARIAFPYFKLPVFGLEDAQYRERHYCYELYHQLRLDWPDGGYWLSAEVDKSGHPIIRGNVLDRTKPDFLVHIPEDMDHNFAAIEVKPINGRAAGVRKDVATLLSYLDYAGYERAYLLVYGEEGEGRAVEIARSYVAEREASERIELWWHRELGSAAQRVRVGR